MPDMLNVVVLIVILGCAAQGGYRCGRSPRTAEETDPELTTVSSRVSQATVDEDPVYAWNDDDWGDVFVARPAHPRQFPADIQSDTG